MSEPVEGDNPAYQLLINGDVDLSQSSISIQVELNENGIPSATLVADNEDAKNYLSNLQVGDIVQVKGLANSSQPYQVNPIIPISWGAVLPCFYGIVQELSPSISTGGQTTGVVAFGLGYQIKEMKVNSWYGDITINTQIANVVTFTNQINQWSFGGTNQAPHIGCYSGANVTWGVWTVSNQNYIQRDATNTTPQSIGGFGFALNEDYDGNQFLSCKLHIVAAIYANSSGNIITDAIVVPLYSIDNGVTWHNFTGNNGARNHLGTITPFTNLGGQFPRIVTSNSDPALSYGITWLFTNVNWSFDGTYLPLADYTHGPPQGEDDYLDIKADLNSIGGFNHNLQIKLNFYGYEGDLYAGSGVDIVYMYLEYSFNPYTGFTARQLLAGDSVTRGIIPNYVNKTLNNLLDSNGNTISIGYSPVGTDYIAADETTDTNFMIPELTLPYNDAFQAINDILRYASGLKMIQGLVGMHWKLDTLGNLLTAPVDNHHVTCVDGSHFPDSVANTIPWVLKPYATPIVVKQSMISQNFKQTVPKANMILLNGFYQYPTISQDPCQGYGLGVSWYWYYVTESGGFDTSPSKFPILVSNEPQIAGNCIQFPLIAAVDVQYTSVWTYPLPNDLDLTKMMGRNTSPRITALIKKTGGMNTVQIRLYWASPSDSTKPDTTQFIYYEITDDLQENFFAPIDLTLPNTKFIKDFKGWQMGQDIGVVNEFLGFQPSTTHTIYDIGSVKFFGLMAISNLAPIGSVFLEMSDFEITGSFIRGLYDPLNISGPFTMPQQPSYGIPQVFSSGMGLRTMTIKNSLLYTNTMDASVLNTYMTLECIYELVRNEIPYITGEIMIPFDPTWLDGQQVWIQAEDVIPIGNQVLSGASNPTSSTVATGIGSYYVNTITWEVFRCTNIVGSVYTWVDQGIVRYKINQYFRILKVIHRFTSKGATTSLQLTNDLFSSFPINTLDSYTTIIRATSPDFQTHTQGSLKASGDFDLGLKPVVTPYSYGFSF